MQNTTLRECLERSLFRTEGGGDERQAILVVLMFFLRFHPYKRTCSAASRIEWFLIL
jgi:hypothetical protein